jgi:aspartate aminotransferase
MKLRSLARAAIVQVPAFPASRRARRGTRIGGMTDMTEKTLRELEFGAPGSVDASLSERVRGLIGSEILKIAAEIRELTVAGRQVCNLTVGDFDPRQFPIPRALADGIRAAYDAGETNYPPSDGVLALRKSVVEFVAREWGPRYPVSSVLIASGARPVLYAAYRAVLDPGDRVIYPVPSWNNNHYTWLSAAEPAVIPTRAEDGFMPTLEQLEPHLGDARLLCLNSPLNPAGTVIEEDALRAIVLAVVEENRRRLRAGRRCLFILHDQVYASLLFGGARHHMPVALVPESAPWVISLDGISKSLAATGLRIGWLLAAPELTQRMKDLVGHMGAWAPRPEQVALARFLLDDEGRRRFQNEMNERVERRLVALHEGFERMRREGYPVRCIKPQGAIYLALQLELIGSVVDGRRLETNEAIRNLLLDEAGLALVPFQAFGLSEESGWFRMSVGAVSLEDIEAVFPRLRRLLDRAG